MDWQAQVRKYAEAKDWDSAMQLVEQEIARAPQDMDVRAWRARVLAWSGKLPEAEKEYLEILKVSRTDPDNWMGLASVYLREGKLAEAHRAISTAEELDPKRSDIHATRAGILRAEGQRTEAQSEFQSALDLDPGGAEAREGLVSVRHGPQHELRIGQVSSSTTDGKLAKPDSCVASNLTMGSTGIGISRREVIEYLRAFLIGREAWAQGNMLTIISGAFGLFRTDLVRAVGGYRANSIGEDMDLVARLHRHLREKKADYEIRFVPDPMCWTEVPSDLRSLGRQRARWQKGLLDVLWPHRDMLFRSRHGRIGCFALPYLWLFELFAPIVEVVGMATIILAASLGVLSREFFLQFMICTNLSISCISP